MMNQGYLMASGYHGSNPHNEATNLSIYLSIYLSISAGHGNDESRVSNGFWIPW